MTQDIHAQRILILDFGSQYTQLIARRIREIGVYSEVRAWDMTDDEIREYDPRGIILAGGPESVPEVGSPRAPKAVFELGVPVLGICYGMQTMAEQLGGKVTGSDVHEFGYAQVEVHGKSALLHDIRDHVSKDGESLLDVWMSHGDKVTELPPGFSVMASTDSCPIAGMYSEEKDFYGLQFHPEVTHTLQGQRIFEHFALELCACKALWTQANIVEDQIKKVREQVGSDKVLLGLSGGVDSSVVAALLHKAIGNQLTCVFVDNGLLRKNEGDQVMDMFAKNMGVKVIRADAEDLFLGNLAGESDPEKKRKIIGNTFIEIFDEDAQKIFLKGAKIAYETIITDFSDSDNKLIASKPLLSKKIHDQFKEALLERENKGHFAEITFIGINSAVVKNHKKIEDSLEVTVDFVSEIITCIKDKEKKIISGNAEKTKTVYDTWVFSKEIRSTNPNWLLIDTIT